MEVTWILFIMKAIHGLMLFDIEKQKANKTQHKKKRCSLLKTHFGRNVFLYSAHVTKAALVFNFKSHFFLGKNSENLPH